MPDYRKALDGDIRGMRVGLVSEQLSDNLAEPEVREAVIKAASVLGELGSTVEEVSIPLTTHSKLITTVPLMVEPALNHHGWVKDRLQDYGRSLRVALLTGSILPAHFYYKAQKMRGLLRQQVHEALERYDVFVMPTLGRPGPEH